VRMITELVMVDNPRDRMGKITKGQNETLNGFLISVMRIRHIKRVHPGLRLVSYSNGCHYAITLFSVLYPRVY